MGVDGGKVNGFITLHEALQNGFKKVWCKQFCNRRPGNKGNDRYCQCMKKNSLKFKG